MDTIDCMIGQLGYQNRKLVFWCPLGKALDELMEINFPKHCQMMSKASVESKVLVLFTHHYEQQPKDDVCNEGGPGLPDVILSPSCTKHENMGISDGESSECSNDSEQEDFQCDSDVDPGW